MQLLLFIESLLVPLEGKEVQRISYLVGVYSLFDKITLKATPNI